MNSDYNVMKPSQVEWQDDTFSIVQLTNGGLPIITWTIQPEQRPEIIRQLRSLADCIEKNEITTINVTQKSIDEFLGENNA